jgi:hypothetical protein
MSADNGIYILECKDQYRVIHAMAIDNLWYSHINENNNQLVPTRIVNYFGKSKYTRDINMARNIAFSMAKRQPILEYGINSIEIKDKTWNQIVREAKELAPLEIKAIQERGNDGRWDWNIQRLEEVINM